MRLRTRVIKKRKTNKQKTMRRSTSQTIHKEEEEEEEPSLCVSFLLLFACVAQFSFVKELIVSRHVNAIHNFHVTKVRMND